MPPNYLSQNNNQEGSDAFESASGPAATSEPLNTANKEPSWSKSEDTTPSVNSLAKLANDQPTPVVKVLSVRGVEYFMMTIALWLSASSFVWAVLALINKSASFQVMAFPVSFLLVCLPIFAFFYLRLRRAELAAPELRFDPSKRRLSQITQILAFIVCISNMIAFIYLVLSKISGESQASVGKSALNLLIVLLVAGGLLAYYWFDEHREFKKG